MPRSEPSGERLQKYLAALGIGSRRKIEGWIAEGKVSVNGRVARLGDRVNTHSRISIGGRPVKLKPVAGKRRVLLYNKPEGEISTRSDPRGRPTVFRKLPKLRGERWIAVGRLDINTGGLILFTTDGALANRLMHPGQELEREYLCRVYGQVSDQSIERLREGIELEDHRVRFHYVCRRRGELSNTWYSVVVKEGKYREVRRMWAAVGCRVSRLVRIRYGNVELPRHLKPGQWIELGSRAISALVSPAGGASFPENTRKKHRAASRAGNR